VREDQSAIGCIIRRTPRSLRESRKITPSTHLHEGDEDDEEGRRAARVVIGVELSVPFLREEFIADHADHPESRNMIFISSRNHLQSVACANDMNGRAM